MGFGFRPTVVCRAWKGPMRRLCQSVASCGSSPYRTLFFGAFCSNRVSVSQCLASWHGFAFLLAHLVKMCLACCQKATKVVIFYHLWLRGPTDTLRVAAIAREQLSLVNPKRQHVLISSLGPLKNIAIADLDLPAEVEKQAQLSSYVDGGEDVTLHRIWSFCKDADPSQVVAYLHSKGSYSNTENNTRLRKYCAFRRMSEPTLEVRRMLIPHVSSTTPSSFGQHVDCPVRVHCQIEGSSTFSDQHGQFRGVPARALRDWSFLHRLGTLCPRALGQFAFF